MANTLSCQDVYALMNEIVSEATARTDLAVVDTSSFVSVGETVLRTGTEQTLNAISTVLGRTIFSVRPYKGKLESLRVAQERWVIMTRKVVNLYDEAEASQDRHTQLYNASTNPQLDDNNSIDMYRIRKPKVLQLNFYGTKVLQKHITVFRDQLSEAFRNESEFARFIDSVMVEFANEVEMLNEAESRATLINYIAGISAMNGTVIDLVANFNATHNTTYTRDELLSTYLTEFMQYIASTIKIYSEKLTDNTTKYHANLSQYAPIMRHTPKSKQKMIMYNAPFITAKATVYSEIFNPQYLDIGDFEGVNYWQSNKDGNEAKINCKPNILNVTTGESTTASAPVTLNYVLGILFDSDAIGVTPQFEYSSTTPFNSAGGYWNNFIHWRFNAWTDYTENAILFVLGEGGAS